jgi:hypothetical protein
MVDKILKQISISLSPLFSALYIGMACITISPNRFSNHRIEIMACSFHATPKLLSKKDKIQQNEQASAFSWCSWHLKGAVDYHQTPEINQQKSYKPDSAGQAKPHHKTFSATTAPTFYNKIFWSRI